MAGWFKTINWHLLLKGAFLRGSYSIEPVNIEVTLLNCGAERLTRLSKHIAQSI